MEERLYTLQLTADELFAVRFDLEDAAKRHDALVASAVELAADGFGDPQHEEYQRERAALSRAVVAKAKAAWNTSHYLEV